MSSIAEVELLNIMEVIKESLKKYDKDLSDIEIEKLLLKLRNSAQSVS